MDEKKRAPTQEAPGAKNLSELAAYQPGSIVSRQLLHKETGTVTLFAFDAGESLSEHTAAYDALVFVLEGAAEVTISGKAFRVRGGETILMPGRRPHAVRALERFKMLLVMIRS